MNYLWEKLNNNIFYNCLLACLTTCIIMFVFFGIYLVQLHREYNEMTKELLNTVAGYLTNATADEYDEIAQEIRHDLIYRANEKYLIQYIPNTATNCPTCQRDYEYQIYFLANNTGEMYHIDTYRRLTGEQISISGGYDEISQTRLNIIYDNNCTVHINQEKDIVSIHRLKATFCDDCIEKILTAIDGQYITSFVIFIPQERAFYPISEDTELQIDNGTLSITYNKEIGEMYVEYK